MTGGVPIQIVEQAVHQGALAAVKTVHREEVQVAVETLAHMVVELSDPVKN
jgi:hypothetical protein